MNLTPSAARARATASSPPGQPDHVADERLKPHQAGADQALGGRRQDLGVLANPEVTTSSCRQMLSRSSGTTFPHSPIWTYRPPRRADRSPAATPPADPEQSTTTSKVELSSGEAGTSTVRKPRFFGYEKPCSVTGQPNHRDVRSFGG